LYFNYSYNLCNNKLATLEYKGELYPSEQAQWGIRTIREFDKVKSKFSTEERVARMPLFHDYINVLENFTRLYKTITPNDKEGHKVKRALLQFFKTFMPPGFDRYDKLMTFEQAENIFIQRFIGRFFRCVFIHGEGISYDYRNKKTNTIFSQSIINPPDYKYKPKEGDIFGDEVEYENGWFTGLVRTTYAGKFGGQYFNEKEFISIKNLNFIGYRPKGDLLMGESPCTIAAKTAFLGEDALIAFANAVRVWGYGILKHKMRQPPQKNSEEWKLEEKNLEALATGRIKGLTFGEDEDYTFLSNYAMQNTGDLSQPLTDNAMQSFGLNSNLWKEGHAVLPKGSLLTLGAIEENTIGTFCRFIRNDLLTQIYLKALYWYLDKDDYETIVDKQNKYPEPDEKQWKAFDIKEKLIIPPNFVDIGNFGYVTGSTKSFSGKDGKPHAIITSEQLQEIMGEELNVSIRETPPIETPYKRALPGVPELKEGTIPPTMTTKPNPKVGGIIKPDQIENETQMQNKLLLQILSNNILNQDEYE